LSNSFCLAIDRSQMLHLEMVVWGDLLRVSWILWQPWTIQLGVMDWGISMVYLNNE